MTQLKKLEVLSARIMIATLSSPKSKRKELVARQVQVQNQIRMMRLVAEKRQTVNP